MLMQLLSLFLLPPILGFLGCCFLPRKWERAIFSVAIAAMISVLALLLFFGYRWLNSGPSDVSSHIATLYHGHSYTFSIDLFFDKIAAVFLGMATVLTTLVLIFSKPYMHRDQGFKRFYSTIFLFFTGLLLIILAGNFSKEVRKECDKCGLFLDDSDFHDEIGNCTTT